MQRYMGASLSCVLVFLWATAAAAAGLFATVDLTETTLEQSIILTLTVDGSQSAEPSLAELPNFDVRSYGRSSKVQMTNGHYTSSVAYSFVLTPKKAGQFQVGAASVHVDGKTYRSEPVRILVHAGESAPPENASLLITSTVSNKTPYVGEQVVFTWRFLRRERIGAAKMSQPSFDDFSVEALGGQQEFEALHHGQRYTVTEIRQALFPLKDGRLQIAPSSLQCEVFTGRRDGVGSPFDDFFGHGSRQTRTLHGPTLSLRAQQPPDPPPEFSGLVGNFSLQATVQHTKLRVGDSTTLVLKLTGTGNLKNALEPSMPPTDAFKVYDDKPTLEARAGKEGLVQIKTFRKALVVGTAGEVRVGPFQLLSFDPNAQQYQTISSPEIVLQVTASGEATRGEARTAAPLTQAPGPTKPTQKLAIEVLGEDILPNYRHLDAVRPRRLGKASRLVWGGIFGGPVGFFLAMAGLRRRQRRSASTASSLRRSRALRQAQAGLRRVGAGNPAGLPVATSRIVRTYLGAMLNVEGLWMTATEVHGSLRAYALPPPLLERLEQFLARCDSMQYSPLAPRVDELGQLVPQALALVTELDGRLR
jgi:hypothetical protein